MKVSVIIPAHDAGETLAVTLQSLQAQTAPGWEAVVIDDGSTDTTAAIGAHCLCAAPSLGTDWNRTEAMTMSFLDRSEAGRRLAQRTLHLRAFLFQIGPSDPITIAATTLSVGLVALFACYLPARRAARVDAVVALRSE